jgi:membrane-bound metal-dependent hydrolase YbcI (DUF457 family)
MNFPSHLAFGMFTALLAWQLTNDVIGALILLIIQIVLILDFVFKKLIQFEPLHTALAMLVVWFIAFFAFPAYHWYFLIAYFTHLFLDIWVHEEIPLLWPFKKQLMYPIKNSEMFVIITSIIGSVMLIVLRFV